MAEQPKPTITGKTLAAIEKQPQLQYASVLPFSRDMPPLASAGKIRPALPDMVRGPLQSLVRTLQAFENPSQATEQIVPDIINLFLAGRLATSPAMKLPARSRASFGMLQPDQARDLSIALQAVNNDPKSARNLDLYGQAAMQMLSNLAPSSARREVNMPIEPRKVENTTYKLKGK